MFGGTRDGTWPLFKGTKVRFRPNFAPFYRFFGGAFGSYVTRRFEQRILQLLVIAGDVDETAVARSLR